MSVRKPATALQRLLDTGGIVEAPSTTPPAEPVQVPQLPVPEQQQQEQIQPVQAPPIEVSPFQATMQRAANSNLNPDTALLTENWLAKKTPADSALTLGESIAAISPDSGLEQKDEDYYEGIGREAEHVYSQDNPEILQEITDGTHTDYLLTPEGMDILQNSRFNLPDSFTRQVVEPKQQPKRIYEGLGNKLSEMEEQEFNAGSVAHVVDNRRKAIAYQTLIPFITSMEPTDNPDVNQKVLQHLEALNTIAMRSGKLNYLDYNFQGLQEALQIRQTHYDPQNNPVVGFVDGAATPAIFKKDGGSEAEATFKEVMAIRFLGGQDGTPKQRIDLFNRSRGQLEEIADVGRGLKEQLLDKESLAKSDELVGQIQLTNNEQGGEVLSVPPELASMESLRIPEKFMDEDPMRFAEHAIALADYIDTPHYKQFNSNLNVDLVPIEGEREIQYSDEDKALLRDNLKVAAAMDQLPTVRNTAGVRQPFGMTLDDDIPAYYKRPKNAWASMLFKEKADNKYLSPTNGGLKTNLVGGLKVRNMANDYWRKSNRWNLVEEVAGDWAPANVKLYRDALKALPKDQPVGDTGKVPAELLKEFDKTLKDLNLMSRNANAVKRSKNRKRDRGRMLPVDIV